MNQQVAGTDNVICEPKLTNQQPIKITQLIQNSQTILTSQTVIELPPPPQSKIKSLCKKVGKFKLKLLKQIITVGLYLSVAFGIFYAFQRSSSISLHEQTYFSSQQVVYPSQIRGLFPPIKGSPTKLYNRWTVSFTNSLRVSPNSVSIYNDFTLEFKSSSNLRIKRKGCEGDLFMNWQIYQYNLYIQDYNFNDTALDKQMIIQPNQQDILCIKNNTNFIDDLKFASVWTINEENLYVLIQKWNSESKNNMQSILFLQAVK